MMFKVSNLHIGYSWNQGNRYALKKINEIFKVDILCFLRFKQCNKYIMFPNM